MIDAVAIAANLSRSYRQGKTPIHAVQEATCSIGRGDQIVLTGRSGSGKSTLLHLLGGLDRPDGGTIAWPALAPGTPLRPRYVSDIFQGTSLLPSLSVLENVRLPLVLMGTPVAKSVEDAQAMLQRFGVGDLATAQPDELSGGQAQRVGIARALVVRPTLLLADEPTGQLDSATASLVMDTLLSVATEIDAALVVATHDFGIATRFPRHWTMTDGVLAAGSSDTGLGVPNALDRREVHP